MAMSNRFKPASNCVFLIVPSRYFCGGSFCFMSWCLNFLCCWRLICVFIFLVKLRVRVRVRVSHVKSI